MKGLLLDQGLPRSTASLLVEAGYSALHAAEIGLSRASDSEILAYARQEDLIVVTLDADFHMLLAVQGAASPSVIRLRQQRLTPSRQQLQLRRFLTAAGKHWNVALLSQQPKPSFASSVCLCRNHVRTASCAESVMNPANPPGYSPALNCTPYSSRAECRS